MNIFGIGLPEMALIMVLALLVFGPKKLPEIGRSLGKAIRGFQEASKEFENEFKKEAERLEKVVNEPAKSEPPMKATLEPPEPKALAAAETEPSPDEAKTAEVVEEVIESETVAPSQQS
ncbi:TatA/E family twin arginine-targeting protein translocase [Phormidium tenue FACHB-886]|nr:TatA/E family twin arginine-targeting protein translocase [Phormidium tenue FACHB-886]